jgi:outer membrane lipoprotein
MIMKMPQILLLLTLSLMFLSCAPVLNREYMREGSRETPFQLLRENTEVQKGRLFILGGVIICTKATAVGSQIEARHVLVDGSGYFKESGRSEGRFLAVLPQDSTMLDPDVYRRGRRVTLAGEFVELRKGRIDEMEYVYPAFEIKQIYLWPKERPYSPAPYYYYDPWFHPYPYYTGTRGGDILIIAVMIRRRFIGAQLLQIKRRHLLRFHNFSQGENLTERENKRESEGLFREGGVS